MSNKAMPVKTAVIPLDGDYEGFEITVRTNTTYATKVDLNSGETDRVFASLRALIVGWNLTDDDGQLLPTPRDGTDLKNAVPDEVLGGIITGYFKASNEAAKLPKA